MERPAFRTLTEVAEYVHKLEERVVQLELAAAGDPPDAATDGETREA